MNQGADAVHKIQNYLNTKAMDALEERLVKFSEWAVKYSIESREYLSFTGNTVTSITSGIYRNGKLTQMVSSFDRMPHPVRAKITDGEFVTLQYPYEGSPRGVRGKMGLGVTHEYGWKTALNELKSYTPPADVPLAMVLCVGTEYATYIESSKGLNVLEKTWVDADPVAIRILKKSIT